MARPTFPRNVGFLPGVTHFKPAGVRMLGLEEVVLGHDEIEAVRLKHLLALSQDEAAGRMNISQPTFHRLLSAAWEKIADAIVNGKMLRIEGGNITMPESSWPSCGRGGMCRQEQAKESKSASRCQGRPSRVAITSVNGALDGMVDERFGRAKKFIVYDMETGAFELAENSKQMNLAQGAGIRTAQNLIGLGVYAVISGHFGPKAFHKIRSAGIGAYNAVDMTVAEAIRRYREGSLSELAEADVEGRW